MNTVQNQSPFYYLSVDFRDKHIDVSVVKNQPPFWYLSALAWGNLDTVCEDDPDEKCPDYYDDTNGYPIDEEWHTLFCYKCGCARDEDDPELKCIDCGAKYINFWPDE